MGDIRAWSRLGGWLGITWPVVFLLVIAADAVVTPQTHTASEELAALAQGHAAHVNMLLHTAAAAIGLLGMGWAISLNVVLQSTRPSRAATLGMAFGVAGFVTFMAMVLVQGSVQTGFAEQFAKLSSDNERAAMVGLFRAVRFVDLGLDFTWDIFISWSMILFGIAMCKTRSFGILWGISAIIIAAPLFALDVWSAPHPAEPDLGPISFLWFMGVSIRMLILAQRTRLDTSAPATIS